MYPVLKKGTRLRGFIDKNHRIRPYMENAYGKFELERGLFYELLDADGTEPFKPPYNDPQILADLKKYGLTETPRFMRVERETLFILIKLNKKFKHRNIFKVLNMFLPIVSVSIFVLGVCQPGIKNVHVGDECSMPLLIFLSMCSVILHEAGHLLAAISAGQKIDHIGITFWSIIPTGAYISVDDKINSRKSEQMQFGLAGIEVNLLITGICLILIGRHYDWAYELVNIAFFNIILIIGNIVPIPGLDGEKALSVLCGISSIGKVAQKSLFDKKRRQRLLRTGWSGYVCFFIFCLVMFLRVIPLLFLLLEWKILCSIPS